MTARGRAFDRGDYRRRHSGTPSVGILWPIDRASIHRLGESIMLHRRGTGEKHDGLDIFCPAGSPVFAAFGGTVLQIVDGRFALRSETRRAGLFADIEGFDGRVYRYLHLGSILIRPHQRVLRGEQLGDVAPAFTSGLGDDPHLHFEIRDGGIVHHKYAPPIDPLTLLPAFRA